MLQETVRQIATNVTYSWGYQSLWLLYYLTYCIKCIDQLLSRGFRQLLLISLKCFGFITSICFAHHALAVQLVLLKTCIVIPTETVTEMYPKVNKGCQRKRRKLLPDIYSTALSCFICQKSSAYVTQSNNVVQGTVLLKKHSPERLWFRCRTLSSAMIMSQAQSIDPSYRRKTQMSNRHPENQRLARLVCVVVIKHEHLLLLNFWICSPAAFDNEHRRNDSPPFWRMAETCGIWSVFWRLYYTQMLLL